MKDILLDLFLSTTSFTSCRVFPEATTLWSTSATHLLAYLLIAFAYSFSRSIEYGL